jgi:hypothetical protein
LIVLAKEIRGFASFKEFQQAAELKRQGEEIREIKALLSRPPRE